MNNLTICIPIASCSALIPSIAILITSECFSELRRRYTKLRGLINVINLLYENTLNQSLIYKNINQKEAEELKKVYNHYLDKRKEIVENTLFKLEDLFGDIISRGNISHDQIIKPFNVLAKIM